MTLTGRFQVKFSKDAKLKYKKISRLDASRSNCNTVAHRILMKYNFGFIQEAFKMKMEKKELSL